MTGNLQQHPPIKLIAIFCAGLGFVALTLLSWWMPAAYRPDFGGMSDKLEHAFAYLLLGALTAIAARHALKAYWLALAIVAYAGILELGQLLIPGRVVSVADFLASAAGAIVGVSIVALAARGAVMSALRPSHRRVRLSTARASPAQPQSGKLSDRSR